MIKPYQKSSKLKVFFKLKVQNRQTDQLELKNYLTVIKIPFIMALILAIIPLDLVNFAKKAIKCYKSTDIEMKSESPVTMAIH